MLLLPCALFAEDGQSVPEAQEQDALKLAPKSIPPIEQKWQQIVGAIDRKDLKEASQLIQELQSLRIKLGYSAMLEYSDFLVFRATEALDKGDTDSSTFYTRAALLLSPLAPEILFKTLRLVKANGLGRVTDQVFAFLKNLPGHWGLLIRGLNLTIYGVLLGISIALYIIYVLLFANNSVYILRRVARKLPHLFRGFLAPLVVIALMCLPCVFGLLWSLLCWSVLLLVFIPEKKWLVFYSGVIFVLWGSLIPIKENVGLWLKDKGIEEALRVASGSYAPWNAAVIQNLTFSRPDDAFVFYTYGQVLRREGRFAEAQDAFFKAEGLMGKQPFTRAERAMLIYLRGDAQQAATLYQEALDLGLRSPEFYFNFSKVKFELGDTAAGREYFDKAQKLNFSLADSLREKENRLGIRSPLTFGEINLPFSYVLRSALVPNAGSSDLSDKVVQSMMRAVAPPILLAIGLALFAGFFLVKANERNRARVHDYFSRYKHSAVIGFLTRLVPGGSWVLIGRPGLALGFLSLILTLSTPVVSWPREMLVLSDTFSGIENIYTILVGILGMLLVYAGFCLDIRNRGQLG